MDAVREREDIAVVEVTEDSGVIRGATGAMPPQKLLVNVFSPIKLRC